MQWRSGRLYIGIGQRAVGGPNGHRFNGSEIEGRPDPRLETRVPDGVPDGLNPTADWMNACQIYGSKSWCRTKGPDEVTGGKIYG
jgi:hypothetical protein